jgi:AraC-like DNA-binding protein
VSGTDVLSDLVRVIRLDGAHFFSVEAVAPWGIGTPPVRTLAPRILPDAEHLIPYHIVTDGRCFAAPLGAAPVELAAGDVIVFPHGDAHVMSSARKTGRLLLFQVTSSTPHRGVVRLGGDGPLSAGLVCGYLGCDRRPFNPLLVSLPRVMHMRGMADAWVGGLTRQVTAERRLGRPGADAVITRLAELMFIEVLRRYLEELPPGQTGWLAGLRDEVVGRALTLLHARPSHPWTLEELAREAAASRSNLAKRFTELIGQPPIQYLAQWRMQIAATLLSQGPAKLGAVSARVGYASEAAFSRAFKKSTGFSPGACRDARAGSQDGLS